MKEACVGQAGQARACGPGDEVLSAQTNYTCGIWAADCPNDTLPYEETSTPATVQNKMPSRDQLRQLGAGSGMAFPTARCTWRKNVAWGGQLWAGGPAGLGVGGVGVNGQGGPCQVSRLCPLAEKRREEKPLWGATT